MAVHDGLKSVILIWVTQSSYDCWKSIKNDGPLIRAGIRYVSILQFKLTFQLVG